MAVDASASLGYWVWRQRKALDLTQNELAYCVGCAAVTVRKIEADERRPSRRMVERLAQCLALSTEETSEFLAIATGERLIYRSRSFTQFGSSLSASNMPIPMAPLIGRTEELNAIVNCLGRKEIRLYTLTGSVGVGKTCLAVEAGLRLRTCPADWTYQRGGGSIT
ncbi:MAG: helix-turn-helix domain-containing protein [Anaerolineales bacterium]|nr:helix-turn-helix domain-containing protein [Anaerolineales bacterium]